MAPSLDPAHREEFARVTRLSVSPGSAAAYKRMAVDVDVRSVLPSVHIPVLLMHKAHEPDEEAGRWVASRLGRRVRLDRPARLGSRSWRYRASPRPGASLRHPGGRAWRNGGGPIACDSPSHRHRRVDCARRDARGQCLAWSPRAPPFGCARAARPLSRRRARHRRGRLLRLLRRAGACNPLRLRNPRRGRGP